MARRLKVFSTNLGFLRAIIAAPSQKAALEAWGVHDNLFAHGAAEEIDDKALVAEAMEKPGEVIRKPIADATALIGGAKRADASKPAAERPKPAKRSSPAPSRDDLKSAEAALRSEESKRDAALAEIARAQSDLDARRTEAEKTGVKAVKAATTARDKAKSAYDRALKAWKG